MPIWTFLAVYIQTERLNKVIVEKSLRFLQKTGDKILPVGSILKKTLEKRQ